MFGRAVRGSKAAAGRLLLGHVDTDIGVRELAIVIPGIEKDDRRAAVLTANGQCFLGQDNFLRHDYWDITDIASIEPDILQYQIERRLGRPGEIAVDDQGRLVVAFERDMWSGSSLMVVKTGELIKDDASALVRFRDFRVVVRDGETVRVLFQRSTQQNAEGIAA